jgi:hypothetical protein
MPKFYVGVQRKLTVWETAHVEVEAANESEARALATSGDIDIDDTRLGDDVGDTGEWVATNAYMATTTILRRGPWQIAYRATNVLCADGARRSARLTSEPDTYSSIPGSVQIRGRTVSGSVWSRETDDGMELLFTPASDGANADALPTWTRQQLFPNHPADCRCTICERFRTAPATGA